MQTIAVVDRNWAIGRNGEQLIYLSRDLKHFKEVTLGHPVILGRKTLSTFPGGRPLKGRRNLILSRTAPDSLEGAEVYRDMESLLAAAPEDSVVIGGASVYHALIGRCDKAYITKLEAEWPADCWFPNLDLLPDWEQEEESEPMEERGVRFRFVTYRRRRTARSAGL